MPAWTVSIGPYGGTMVDRKYKKFEINKKVRMDSAPEFTAIIEYLPDITFNDIVTFERDGKVEWKGFVEDMEIDWDANGRYLNIGGRDISLLLWRKYVENFINMIKGTGGFFGYVSASELIKFLLRTPRSDLPTAADGTSIYPFNKEGWGIDISRFNELSAYQTAYGDINWAILRKSGLGWRNSGDPYASSTEAVDAVGTTMNWIPTGTPPYLDTIDDSNYIQSNIGVDDVAEFTFGDVVSAQSISSCKFTVVWKPDVTFWTWITSDCWIYIWVQSFNNGAGDWCYIGDFGGKGSIFSNPWRTWEFDISGIIRTVDDVNNAKVRFVEKSAQLSTFITYAALGVSYIGNGTQTTDDWVQIPFQNDGQQDAIMGIYVECREHPELFPRNYKITCAGTREDFTTFDIESDPNNHIDPTLDANREIEFDSYDDEVAYLAKDYGVDIIDAIDMNFSFMIDTTEPHPFAYIPFCLSNNLEDFNTMFTSAHEYSILRVANSNNVLTLRCESKDSTGNTFYPIYANIRYFVKVTRNSGGSSIRYQVWNDSSMTTPYLVFDDNVISSILYRYRFQAITYDGYEWAKVFSNTMDIISPLITNGDFETGDFTGWSESSCSIDSSDPHSGTYCANINQTYGNMLQTSLNILKDNVTLASFWHKLSSGTFIYRLYYSDATYDDITVTGTGSWTEEDMLASWANGKTVTYIWFFSSDTDNLYVDDIVVITGNSNSWTTMNGTATRATDPTGGWDGNGCQKITAGSDGQYYYFEQNIPAQSEVQANALIKVPPPLSEVVNVDLHVNSHSATGFPQWTGVNASPYLHDDDDTNVVTSDAETTGAFTNEWGFEDLDGKYGSFAPSTGSDVTLNIKAKLYDGVGGHATNFSVKVEVWVQSSDVWTTLGYFDCTDTSYATAVFNSLGLTLLSVQDWNSAKLRLSVDVITGGGADKGGIRVTYAYFTCKGTGYMGPNITLMKIYNNAIASGPDPIDNYIAQVNVVLDDTAISDQDKWLWYVDGYHNSHTSDDGISTATVTPNVYHYLRLYTKTNATTGYFQLYEVIGGIEYFLCGNSLGENLDNDVYGPADRYDLEADFGAYMHGDVYLDDTTVYEEGEVHTHGYIYSGYGPDVELVNVTGNIYPDIIHSWSPRVTNNLKISITASDSHVWEITQIYVYKTDIEKYQVVNGYMSDPSTRVPDFVTPPQEYKLTFSNISYNDCVDADIGKQILVASPYTLNVATLIDFNNDLREWIISTPSIPLISGYNIDVSGDGAVGYGTLSADAETSYSGGPYLTIGAELDPSFEYSTVLEPMNIAKNRLFEVLWDLCIAINDNYMPYEWWIDYDVNNTFHIGSHHGFDKSATVSFVTGVNMEGVKYQKSSRDTYQRCQIVGQGEGTTQDVSSSFWTDDAVAMDEINGFIEDIVNQKQINNPKLANRYAKVKLKLDASPKRKNAITCTISRDTYVTFDYTDPTNVDTYNIGDDVWITDIFTALDEALRIYNIKKVVENNGEVVTLIVQAPYLDIGNVWTEIWTELKKLGIVGTIKEDWSGEGTDSSKMSADKISTLFTVTAKNVETDTAITTSPQWVKTPDSPPHGAGFNSENNNLAIYGGDTQLDAIAVEARYSAVYESDGITVRASTPTDPSDLFIKADIPITQMPKFTAEFKIWEPLAVTTWEDGDYVEFGMYNGEVSATGRTGLMFRVIKESSSHHIYALYYVSGVLKGLKKICTVNPSTTINDTNKYKVEIITDFSGVIKTVTFNVYDMNVENSLPLSVVFMNIDNSMIVRPIYLHASGTGSAGKRCIMHFYDIKCQRDVV